MCVARLQTKRAISIAKHAIGVKLGGKLALGYIEPDFHKKIPFSRRRSYMLEVCSVVLLGHSCNFLPFSLVALYFCNFFYTFLLGLNQI